MMQATIQRWSIHTARLLLTAMVLSWHGHSAARAHLLSAPDAGAPPMPVIFDTDMAADDWLALLYLLHRPEVKLVAITVTGAGESHCAPGIAHAASLVALAGHAPIPIACGPDKPLRGNQTFPDSWRRNVDNFYGLTLPPGTNPTPNAQVADILEQAIAAYPGALHILATGPLTNIALLAKDKPDLARKIARLTVMGGAVTVPGNVQASLSGLDNQTAEWNIFADPHAAQVVLESGMPVAFVTLDATSQAPLTPAFYRRLEANHTTPSSTFVHDLFTSHYDMFVGTGDAYTWYFWDPLSAAIMVHPGLAVMQAFRLKVVQHPGPEQGRTKPVLLGGHWALVSVTVDARRFEDDFLETLQETPSRK